MKKKKICAGILALTLTFASAPIQTALNHLPVVNAIGVNQASSTANTLNAVTGDMLSVNFSNGSADDQSATANTNSVIGTPIVSNDQTLDKNVCTFNGSSAYMYPFDDTKYSKMNSVVTIECVFKLDEVPATGEHDIFSNQQSGGVGIGLENGRLQFYCNVNGTYIQPNAEVEADVWYHAVGVYDGSKVQLYLNGVLVDSKTATGNLKWTANSTAKNFVIGGDSAPNNTAEYYSKGSVYSANLYSNAISAEQISANYDEIFGISEEITVPKADMLDVDFTGDSAEDLSETNNALTVKGSPVISENSDLNCKMATFNGQYDAYMYNFDDEKYSKMKNTVTIESTFMYNEIQSSGEQDVFSNQQSGGVGLGIENGKLQFYCNVNGTYIQPNATIEAGRWYHVVGVYDGTTAKLYINGELVSTKNAPGNIKWTTSPNAKNFVIGGDSNTTNGVEYFSNSSVINAKLYSSALSSEQVAYEYNQMTPVLIDVEGDSSALKINTETEVAAAKASNGGQVSVEIKDPDGNAVSVSNGKFTPQKEGNYTFIYSVTGKDGKVYKNTIVRPCSDPSNLKVHGGFVTGDEMYAGNKYTVGVHANVDKDVSVNGLDIDVKYNPEIMSFVTSQNSKIGCTVTDDGNGTVNIKLSSKKLSENDYKVFSTTLLTKLSFEIKEEVETCETTLSFDNAKLYNGTQISDIDFNGVSKTISINAKDELDLNQDGVIGVGDIALAEDNDQAEKIAEQAKIYPYKHAVIITMDGGGVCFDDEKMYYAQNGSTISTTDSELMQKRKNEYSMNLFNNVLATSYSAKSETPTISAQNYSSILHGVEYQTFDSDYKITNTVSDTNYYPDFGKETAQYPSVFKTIYEQAPQRATAAFSEWAPILTGIIEPDAGTYNWATKNASGQSMGFADLSEYIRSDSYKNTAMIYLQSDYMDGVGHSNGYYTEKYYNELLKFDDYFEDLINALEEVDAYDDTLLVINSDHGGTAGGIHGGTTDQEYDVQIGLGGQTVDSGKKLTGGTNHDITPIALSGLRLDTPEVMNGNDDLTQQAFLNQYELAEKSRETETVTAFRTANNSLKLKLSDTETNINSVDVVIPLDDNNVENIETEGTIVRNVVENGKLYLTIIYNEIPSNLCEISFDNMSDNTEVEEYMLATSEGKEIYGDLVSKTQKALSGTVSVSSDDIIEGDCLSDIDLSGVFEADEIEISGTLEWKTPETIMVEGENECEWIFIPDDEDYSVVYGSVKILAQAKSDDSSDDSSDNESSNNSDDSSDNDSSDNSDDSSDNNSSDNSDDNSNDDSDNSSNNNSDNDSKNESNSNNSSSNSSSKSSNSNTTTTDSAPKTGSLAGALGSIAVCLSGAIAVLSKRKTGKSNK